MSSAGAGSAGAGSAGAGSAGAGSAGEGSAGAGSAGAGAVAGCGGADKPGGGPYSLGVWKCSVLSCNFWQFKVINRDLLLSPQLAPDPDILAELSSHTTGIAAWDT